MLFEYSCLQNNGQKTKWLIQTTENSRYGSDQRERVINPELFGLITTSLLISGFHDDITVFNKYYCIV